MSGAPSGCDRVVNDCREDPHDLLGLLQQWIEAIVRGVGFDDR